MKIWHCLMKKSLSVVLLLCLLCGCDKQGGTEEKQQEAESEYLWLADFNRNTYGSQGIFRTESGFVHFLDAQNGQKFLICDDVACDHQKGDCSAYFDGLQTYATLEDDHLLLVTEYGGDKVGDLFLYEAAVNGGERKEIAYLGNMQNVFQILFREDVIVIAYYNSYDENMKPMDENQAGIYVYDRKKNSGEVVWEMRQVNAIIPSVAYHDNALYFSAFYIDLVNHAEEKLFVELCKYDVEKNEMRVLGEELDDTVGLSVCRDRILYPCQGKLWCYDTKTGEKSIAAEEAMTTLVCCQTEQLLLTADDVYYSCIPGEAPKQIAEKEKLGIQAIFPNVIYAYNYDTPTGNGELVYWETVDFLNGNLNAMKTFE